MIHNGLLDIDVTLHSDVQSQVEQKVDEKRSVSKTQGKVSKLEKNNAISYDDIPRAQLQEDQALRDEPDVEYSGDEIEREKQS